ncbi:PucR family transcriptional regulator [Actinomadura rubrisoli]|uniref:PucR family transcriptional regulator n=1 Tax=Actinomadura rubrisoli TaxID=2530368 RepID=A0A4R5C957_9ACTN|nr:helix-turn-helix domain-containing protein [Actinomadura rubrisoli]TDD96338.1 hypothetical protein E1298_03450 [Actinomadura rubrisoli]
MDLQRELVECLTLGQGMDALVALLRRRLDAPAAFIDLRGSVLAQAPRRAVWPVEALCVWQPDGGAAVDGLTVVPVELEGDVVALLCTATGPGCLPLLGFAANVAALELGRLHAILSGRRELAAQLFHDIITAAIPDWDSERRLRGFGVDTGQANHVILGAADCSPKRLQKFPWNLHALLAQRNEPYVRASVQGRLMLLVPEGEEMERIARLTLGHLAQLGPNARVGVSGAHPGVSGVRLGYYEAQDALQRGPGINHREQINLGAALLCANLDLPMYELAAMAMQPLLDYDEQHGGQLVDTLHAYFSHDCATGPAAEELFIHRNTMRYRLSLIERITGRDLSSFGDRIHFWLATTALRQGRRPQ